MPRCPAMLMEEHPRDLQHSQFVQQEEHDVLFMQQL